MSGARTDAPPWPMELRAAFDRHSRSASHADAVHLALSEAITGGIAEPGRVLREEELASLFRVSRTPVREALMRLEAERLAIRTRRGLAVGDISEEQIIEVYEIREVLDGLAARLAARFKSDSDLAELQDLHIRMTSAAAMNDPATMAVLNVDFHRVLARAAHSSMLLEFVDAIHRWVLRFRRTTFEVPERAEVALAEHAEIIAAIAAGDAIRAESLAKNHMRGARDVRIRMATQTVVSDPYQETAQTRE